MAGTKLQTRASLGDLGQRNVGPMFEDVFEQNLVRYSGRDIAEQIFGFKNTDKSTFRVTGLTGYKLLEEFNEGTAFPKLANTKGFQTLYNMRDYGGSVTVTDDMLKDREKLGGALDEMANLASSTDITEVKGVFMILNGGFGTVATVQGFSLHRFNSEALFSASHARADGGTAQSNTSATSIALTELNLETGRLALVKQLADNGLPMIQTGMITLAVPDDLEKNAVIFTGSQLRATTANNDLNFYRGRLNVASARWLNSTFGGSATAWFLLVTLPGLDKPLKAYRLGGPEFFAGERDGETWNRTMSVKNRVAYGNDEWKGTWASPGA